MIDTDKDAITRYIEAEKFKTFQIPFSQVIQNFESGIFGQERERFWMFLNGVILGHKSSCRRRDRKYKGVALAYNDLPISSVEFKNWIGDYANNETKVISGFGRKAKREIVSYGLKDKMIQAGIITIKENYHYDKNDASKSRATIYSINTEIMDNTTTKTVTLQNKNNIKAMALEVTMRAERFTKIDRHLLCGAHKGLSFVIDSNTFAQRHLNDAIQHAINKGNVINDDWHQNFKVLCSKIDEINLTDDMDKWTTCSVDRFGKRLHHTLTFVPTSARQYARLRSRGETLIPLFECDLTTAQVYFQYITAIKEGIQDKYLTEDLKNDMYSHYATKRGFFTRGLAKHQVFRAIFGEANNEELQAMEKIYPQFVEWLKREKTTVNEAYQTELGTNYAPYKNTSIKAQRAESTWARRVWADLKTNRIKFLPVHDSVIIFGSRTTSPEEIEELKMTVQNAMDESMCECFGQKAYFTVKPSYKITDYKI